MEVETDCQALRDVLMNDKLSATHARWRDGVLAHNIIDVRHIPGVTNIADGLSQQYENTPKSGKDGSEWDVDSDWETGAGLVYGINCISIPPATHIRKKIRSYLDVYSLHSTSSTIDSYPFCSTHRQALQIHRH